MCIIYFFPFVLLDPYQQLSRVEKKIAILGAFGCTGACGFVKKVGLLEWSLEILEKGEIVYYSFCLLH